MKKVLFAFIMMFCIYKSDAQQLPVKKADSLSIFIKNAISKSIKLQLLSIGPNQSLALNSSFQTMTPVVTLNGNSKMPIKKLGGYYTMPVKRIGTEKPEVNLLPALPGVPAFFSPGK